MKKVILIVDDEELVLDSLEIELANSLKNYIIESAQSGYDALELLYELVNDGYDVQVVISDYIMPNMKGDELLSIIHERFPKIKKIMLTGQATIEGVANVINKAGLYRYISKPWDKSDLVLTLKGAIKSYKKDSLLEKQYEHLEKTVKKRTQELHESCEDLKYRQEQLVQSEKIASLGQLVNGIAHEINTPVGISITAISKLDDDTHEILELFQQNKMKHSQLKRYFEDALIGCQLALLGLQRTSVLVSNFKEISTDQNSQIRRIFNIKSYLEDIVLSMKLELKKTKHKICIVCPKELELDSYPGALFQIITNLILNSLLHAYNLEDEGNICINVSLQKGNIMLYYSDDGKGISKKNLKNIFDPFFTTRRGSQNNTGLGLHILFNLVDQVLKGHINCESKEGHGVLFTIKIPMHT